MQKYTINQKVLVPEYYFQDQQQPTFKCLVFHAENKSAKFKATIFYQLQLLYLSSEDIKGIHFSYLFIGRFIGQ